MFGDLQAGVLLGEMVGNICCIFLMVIKFSRRISLSKFDRPISGIFLTCICSSFLVKSLIFFVFCFLWGNGAVAMACLKSETW